MVEKTEFSKLSETDLLVGERLGQILQAYILRELAKQPETAKFAVADSFSCFRFSSFQFSCFVYLRPMSWSKLEEEGKLIDCFHCTYFHHPSLFLPYNLSVCPVSRFFMHKDAWEAIMTGLYKTTGTTSFLQGFYPHLSSCILFSLYRFNKGNLVRKLFKIGVEIEAEELEEKEKKDAEDKLKHQIVE